MASLKPFKPTKAEIDSALDLWAHFTKLMKYSVVGACGIVAFLALAFINW
jgi:hypothetical protein